MNLPRRIQQQLEEADRIQATLAEPAPAPVQDPPPEPVADPATPPTPPPEPTPQQVAPTPDPDTPSPEQTLQRYKTLEGKYNAEVPELVRQLRARDAHVQELTDMVRQLKEQVATPPPAPAPTPPASPVDAKDVENFGADLVEMVQRAANAVFQQQAGPLVQRFETMAESVKQLELRLQGVNKTAELTAEQTFYSALATKVPDWRDVNVDSDWIAWLQEIDPIHGRNRQAALDEAASAFDADRVAKIFNAFKATKAPPPNPQPTPPNRTAELARQVAPARAGSQPSAPAAPVFWTQQQIREFYSNLRRGLVSSEDAVRIEKEIDAAVAEGRVR